MRGTFVAVGRELGEALIDQREPAVDLGDHPLRRAFLLRNASREAVERRIRPLDVRSERARGFHSGGADSRRCLLDQGRNRGGLGVDPRPDFVKRGRRPVEQGVKRAREIRLSLADPGGRANSGGVDLGESSREPVAGFGHDAVGLGGALGEDADLLAQLRGPGRGFAPDRAQLLGDRPCRGFGTRKVVEKHGDVGAGGFGCLVERLAMPDQPFAARIELAGHSAESSGGLGDEAHGTLGGVTREFDSSSERLVRHGQALDQAAEAARTDIAVLLDDLPRAEATARAIAEQLRAAGSDSTARAAQLGEQVGLLAERTAEADRIVSEATDRLAARLAEIDTAGIGAAAELARPKRMSRARSTHCSTGHRRRWTKSGPGSTPRPRPWPPWSSRRRPASAPRASKPKARSRRMSIARTPRSTACRAAFPSRNGRRSG